MVDDSPNLINYSIYKFLTECITTRLQIFNNKLGFNVYHYDIDDYNVMLCNMIVKHLEDVVTEMLNMFLVRDSNTKMICRVIGKSYCAFIPDFQFARFSIETKINNIHENYIIIYCHELIERFVFSGSLMLQKELAQKVKRHNIIILLFTKRIYYDIADLISLYSV
jgi:hypothetical protein